jgi:elongation factor P
MINPNELKKGIRILIDGQPYEVLEANHLKKAQRRPVVQTKMRNLITGAMAERNIQQGETFDEAELPKFNAKFLYVHRDRYFFCKEENPSERFDMGAEQIGSQAKFLKPNQIVETILFNEKIVSIVMPIKVQLRVKEATPGVKGDRAQSGTKVVILETGAEIQAPLFVEEGDVIEINTESEEYVRRIE